MKIKSLFFSLILAALVGSFSIVSAQFVNNVNNSNTINCEGRYVSPIQCGYYAEGYQDGVNDARANRDSDYDRYDDKFDDKYESFYVAGYDRGYASIRSFARWNNDQKKAYDRGYDYGDDDRDRGISRLPRRYEGRYDKSYEAFYRRGYLDGYNRRPKNYDVPVGNARNADRRTMPFPGGNNRGTFGRGSASGSLIWTGQVDGRVNLIFQGNTARTQVLSGRSIGAATQRLSAYMPRRQAQVTVRTLDGRGSATVIQQPSRTNNYATIVQVDDSRGGSDNYRLQIDWSASRVQETYSRGRLLWSGRVDHTAIIEIAGDDVYSFAQSGRDLTNVRFDIDGYLAARPGVVRVNKQDGRGSVTILEQPTIRNNYTAKIQISDPKGDDDEYEIEVTW